MLITEDEAQRLATAITHVTKLYDVPIMDEKTRAWLNLGMVGVLVYGTRVTAVIVERKKKKQLTIVAPPLRPEEPTPPVEV